jgi:hypothetical protein
MATVLSADVLFQDPEGAVRGYDAVDAKVAALLGVPTWSVAPRTARRWSPAPTSPGSRTA